MGDFLHHENILSDVEVRVLWCLVRKRENKKNNVCNYFVNITVMLKYLLD